MSESALKSLTDGAVTGTASVALTPGNRRFGGGRLIADGTNTGTVQIHDGTDATGDVIFELSSQNTMTDYAPIVCLTGNIYYVISGTGASFQPYEWLQRGYQ